MTDETDLKLGDIVIPVGAGRGISQDINLVANGDLRRTVNGELIDMTRDQNRKFTSSVKATDMATPAISGLWRGQQLVVECVAKFRQNVFPADDAVTLIRPAVAGSVIGRKADGSKLVPTGVAGVNVTFAENVVMVQFRPVLNMLVANIDFGDDEYAASTDWSIDLEEV